MIIDFELCKHYDSIEEKSIGCNKYIMTIHTIRARDAIRAKFGIIAELNQSYRFKKSRLFDSLSNFLLKERDFTGQLTTDSWPLFAEKNREYWEGLFGKGYIKNSYPIYGKELWDSLEDLQYESR